METIFGFLKAALGIFVVMAAWFLWNAYVGRKSGCRGDHDVLEHMTEGCAGCKNQGHCHNRKEHHHESA